MVCSNYGETPPTAILAELRIWKMQKFGFCLPDI